jgi:hypothetical protein
MAEIDALVETIGSFPPEAWPHRGLADPEIGPPVGDARFELVHWHARAVQKALKFRMPVERGRRGRQAGADLAELVDHWLVVPAPARGYPDQIADSPSTVFAARAGELIAAIEDSYLISLRGEPTKAYLVGLATWLGCVGMAELLRPIYASGEPRGVTEARAARDAAYAWLERRWEFEDGHGNPWVRLGVESARLFKAARNEPVQDGWVPADSPYWRNSRLSSRAAPSFSLRGSTRPAIY